MDTIQMYEQEYLLQANWRRLDREGNLPFAEGRMVPRDPAKITATDRFHGDVLEREIIWLCSIENLQKDAIGGRVTMCRPGVASHLLIWEPSLFRTATPEEIAGEKKRQADLLNERISGARNLSYKDDTKYGKRS